MISGTESLQFRGQEYLIVGQDSDTKTIYEIRYKSSCSHFKQALFINNILAVGHQKYFYLFNPITHKNIIRLEIAGYFGHLYFHNELFYVAGAYGLYCIDKGGLLLWQNNNLLIDGVVINNFTDNSIFGSGECDPPSGWQDFILDIQTGYYQRIK